ncbi:DUF4391 domain-containing protein [Clostridium perfringens]|uniref:DUF4391 domain-containing protein n=1 Tax=Clostridium perfringens TaxID=1502 RepID=UPI002857256C|nr:DUF4391 domain-containing protein [Clostridium perfringens]MDK0898715.1 DUF4391 domain-containing protein [Clostridium perfringens]MDK0904173.1 DUF4391 domain-containing protein [Clostridium perfringens]MDM0902452.1 DUF4391 domain-containing protein [Clostridium perfringens]MDM0937021.1 DUF4391 domain-containing protein [Clostridium perfringens]
MDIKEVLDLPVKSVVNKKLPKNQIQGKVDKKSSDILSKDVEGIYIYSVLNKSTSNIMPYQNEDFNISEVMVLEVKLREIKNINTIRKIFHNIISNPIILVLSYEGKIEISVGMKRLNKNDSMKVILGDIVLTKFIDLVNTESYEKKFLEQIKITSLPQLNLYELYKSLENHIVLTKFFEVADDYIVGVDKIDKALELLNKYEKFEEEINTYEKNKKAEANFGRQMEWHVKIKKLEKKLDSLKEEMKGLC